MSEFVSFPRSGIDDHERNETLYDKISSAASQMFQSFRDSDSSDSKTGTPMSSGHSSRRTSMPGLPNAAHGATGSGHAIEGNGSVGRPKLVVDTPKPLVDRPDLASATHGRMPSQSSLSGPQLASLSPQVVQRSPPRPKTKSNPLFSTQAPSSATVSISSEQAVPHLPTAAPEETPSVTRRPRSTSIETQRSASAQSRADADSVFSVNSTSASRAYLASQYSRTRSRAAPGRLSREFWMKDESATSCFHCNRAFTTFRRKHHCRVCGQIFCSACTDLIDGAVCGAAGRRVRCCKSCEESLAQHTSSEEEGDMSFWSQAPQEDSRWEEERSLGDSNSGVHGSMSDSIIPEEVLGPVAAGSPDNNVLSPIEAADHPESYSRLSSPVYADESMHARSFLGPSHHHSMRTARPRAYSQLSRDDDSVHPQSFSSVRPGSIHPPSIHPNTNNSSNSYGYNYGNYGNYMNSAPYSNLEDQYLFPLSNAHFPNSSSVELNNAAIKYLSLFLDQLLKDCDLDPEQWASTLLEPILELASGLHLEINDKLSPREWVKIKRIPGGEPHDIDYINGIVFTHSLARKVMPKRLVTPRILLISFPIEYVRNERYVSLVPVIAQEKEYLKKLVARITALKPTILLTSSHVSGIAMDMLQAEGVTVAQNIRESALFRLSRITRADLLTSIDRLSVAPQLGICEVFEQRSYRYKDLVKTFLFFFVRQVDPGRCALVRGGPEISSILKVVLEVMAEICYSLKAETALMRDQFIMVPNLTEPPAVILSSSPFVDYGAPFLQKKTRDLEDTVVELGNQLDKEQEKDERYILNKKLDFVRSKWFETSQIWESMESSHPFMFNPSSHQNLIVLYSLVCSETATPCVGPDSQLIEFYLSTDQTLGKFVESSILQARDFCPDGCKRPMSAHYRSYVNGNGMVTVVTQEMACKVPGLEQSILMWSYCTKCEQQMPVVPMSSTTWKCSMGKYLEISFYGEPMRMRASPCTHNVYRDHVRYFGWHGYALRIEYSNVALNEVTAPPRVLRWNPEVEVEMKNNAYQEWRQKLLRFWASLLESLDQVKIEGLEDSMIQLSQQKLQELKVQAEHDRDDSIAVIDKLYNETESSDYLGLNKFLENYQQLVDQWHSDIADFDGQFFPTERDIRRVTAQHIRGLLGEEPSKPKLSRRGSTLSVAASRSEDSGEEGESKTGAENRKPDEEPTPTKQVAFRRRSSAGSLNGSSSKPKPIPSTKKPQDDKSLSVSGSSKSSTPPSVKVKSLYGNDINLSMPGIAQHNLSSGGNRVAILAEHFEELSREFERERKREKSRLYERQKAIRQRHAHPIAEVFEDLTDVIEDWPQSRGEASKKPQNNENTPSENQAQPVVDNSDINEVAADASTKIAQIATNTGRDPPEPENKTEDKPDEKTGDIKKPEEAEEDKREPSKLSLIHTLANFWAERSSTRWNGMEYVLQPREHYFTNSTVVIRESEPSSLIAFCLSLPDYLSRIHDFYGATAGAASIPSDRGEGEDNQILEHAMLRQTGTHMRYHFERNNVKVSCKIFYSEQFDALRRKCQVGDKFIQSLSRCSTWDSTGGKSGSAFLKTLDDRLILKELSHGEFDSFVNFAPSYFEYMSQALFHDLPTVLSKIFGVYQITIRNTSTSQQVKMYVLVMENLFYGTRFSKVFDLKGSMRNRKVMETGKENEVLLDENMVEYIYESPLFVREQSKRMLRTSLYNDTLFLTKMNVMDYSLVIGLDERNSVIVAGIIDYIRTYTWDKKIESWVKTRTTTSGVKEPTVVSPKQYKGRFRESMERYFVMVPDCWSQPGSF